MERKWISEGARGEGDSERAKSRRRNGQRMQQQREKEGGSEEEGGRRAQEERRTDDEQMKQRNEIPEKSSGTGSRAPPSFTHSRVHNIRLTNLPSVFTVRQQQLHEHSADHLMQERERKPLSVSCE